MTISRIAGPVLVALAVAGSATVTESSAEGGHEGHEEGEHAEHEHVSELDGIRALHAWTPATSNNAAFIFVEIENDSGADVTLTGGESDIASSVELVGFELVEGEGAYAGLPGLPIAADSELTLAPNELALRLEGLDAPLREGEQVEMELTFDSGHLPIHVQVEAAGATQHSHAGHAH